MPQLLFQVFMLERQLPLGDGEGKKPSIVDPENWTTG